jgi:DNA polymerase-4
MAHYQGVSRQVFEVFRRLTPDVEGLSLDEAFLEITGIRDLARDPRATALEIKRAVHEHTGLTASVGAGPNKLVAKIASDLEKPDGLVVLFGDAVADTLAGLPVRAVGGIGPKTAARLQAIGIGTLGELAAARPERLAPVFGRYTERMQQRALGIDDRPVTPHREPVSLSAEETFATDLEDPVALRRELRGLADKVAARLRKKSLRAARVAVKIRRADFTTVTRQRALSPASADSGAIGETAWQLLQAWRAGQPDARIRLLGVTAGKLTRESQLNLFEVPRSRLDEVTDDIHRRFGDDSLRPGSDLPPGDPHD